MSGRPIKVMIVDDQVLMREGLKTLLDLDERVEVVGEAADGVEALEKVRVLKPEVALVDVRMPRMDGVELVKRLSVDHPSVAAVVLTTFEDDEYVFGGLRAGARGYLLKDTPSDELVAAVVKARRGETVLGGPVATRVVSELMKRPEAPPGDDAGLLSEREVEVLGLVGGVESRDLPSPVHHRGDGEEPRIEDPAQARPQGPHPGRPPRRRTRLREAPPVSFPGSSPLRPFLGSRE